MVGSMSRQRISRRTWLIVFCVWRTALIGVAVAVGLTSSDAAAPVMCAVAAMGIAAVTAFELYESGRDAWNNR